MIQRALFAPLWLFLLAPIRPMEAAGVPAGLQPYLEKHCYDCHDDTTQKGGLRLDNLAADFSQPEGARTWVEVFDKVRLGEMPPKKKERPPAVETQALLGWLKTGLSAADEARRKAEGRVTLRRLNRDEYERTMNDLLGVEVELKDLLPEDTASMGFDNQAEALNVSTVLMERYLDAADRALDAALAKGARPETKHWDIPMGVDTKIPEKDYRLKTGALVLPDETFVYLNSGDLPIVCDRFKAPAAGRYRFHITAGPYQSPGQARTMGIIAGSFDPRAPKTRAVGYYDLAPEKVTAIDFTESLPVKGTFKILAYGLGKRDLSKEPWNYPGPGVAVYRVVVDGPLIEQWPPAGQTRLFGALDLSKGTLGDAEKALGVMAPRAFRRPIVAGELTPYLALVKAQMDAQEPFEAAVRVGLKAMLCAPDFLFAREHPGRLSDYEVASRLSYFLWSTMPDDALLRAAAKGTLSQPATLRAETERMLQDPKARAFTENFTGQWLSLRQIEATTPDKKLYPEFDDLLQNSMVEETRRFFDELLRKDLSALNFVASDFSVLNGRLAEHYGIPGVTGQEFRVVKLPPGSHRGGLLTQAAILKVTANGTVTSPVVRGAWVLRNLLGTPPKPPPPGTPAIEPDIRGAKTIREQLDKHRSNEACASCHRKMDPPGFALESFDVIGGWRENYRSLGLGAQAKTELQGRRVGYKIGPPVDCTGEMADGRGFKGIDDMKALLLADPDQIARNLTEKLLTYATGGGLSFSDRAAVEEIVARERAKKFPFRSLIHDVVQSRTFLSK